MAGTGSLQSEPRVAGAAADDRRAALARFLAAASRAASVELTGFTPLRGGAIQENWAVDVRFSDGAFSGEQRLVLRTAAPTGVAASLGRLEEFAVLKAAFAAGVTVPEPLWASDAPEIMGKPFFMMRRVEGTAAAHKITRDPTLDPALPAIAERLGRELARIHAIQPPRADLAFLAPYEAVGPARQIAGFRAYLDSHPIPRPVLEWGIHWLETHIPPPAESVLCHHDFRTGNYMLDGTALTGILDWEFSGWGDPYEDIGWFCCKGWRFARLDREAGGIADRAPFYRGYESGSGRSVDPQRVFFWELLASVRWAVIALQQSDRYMIAGERNLDLALTGRRATECELEILMLLDRGHEQDLLPLDKEGSGWRKRTEHPEVHDLPSGPALLALARDVLLRDLMPLLPQKAHLAARLVANSMAIAEREEVAAEEPAQEILREVEKLYGEARRGKPGLLARLARDLRVGAFASSEPRDHHARRILWRITIAKLRSANPRFLNANGFS